MRDYQREERIRMVDEKAFRSRQLVGSISYAYQTLDRELAVRVAPIIKDVLRRARSHLNVWYYLEYEVPNDIAINFPAVGSTIKESVESIRQEYYDSSIWFDIYDELVDAHNRMYDLLPTDYDSYMTHKILGKIESL